MDGRDWLEAVRAERIGDWARSRGPAQRALAFLLDGRPHAQATVIERVGAGAAGERWHDRATGQPPDDEPVRASWYGLLRTLRFSA